MFFIRMPQKKKDASTSLAECDTGIFCFWKFYILPAPHLLSTVLDIVS